MESIFRTMTDRVSTVAGRAPGGEYGHSTGISDESTRELPDLLRTSARLGLRNCERADRRHRLQRLEDRGGIGGLPLCSADSHGVGITARMADSGNLISLRVAARVVQPPAQYSWCRDTRLHRRRGLRARGL